MPKLPPQLLNSLIKQPELNLEAFVAAHENTHSTSIRLNPFKKVVLDFEPAEAVPWSSYGFYLKERPYFTHDPLFHAGCYYVQEAGSMFLEEALKQTLNLEQNIKVLDLCAAPGGKSTLINSILSPESLLVANEIVKSRADILAQNLSRWGTANCVVTNNSPEKFSEQDSFFDAIIVDAPCSGSGLFRKQPEAIEEWSVEAVSACSLRQKNILNSVLSALKQNGILLYSTCSYSVEENEDIVQWLVSTHNLQYVPINISSNTGIVETNYGYRFYPHLTKSEGFFCAVLRKTDAKPGRLKPIKTAPTPLSKNELNTVSPFVSGNTLCLYKINGRIYLLNQAVLAFLSLFEKKFYFKKAGTLVGEIKGVSLVPAQELAWSVNAGNGFKRFDLNGEAALKYLKKQEFLSHPLEEGLALLSYKQYGLGWAKVLANRVNNYLPPELKVMR